MCHAAVPNTNTGATTHISPGPLNWMNRADSPIARTTRGQSCQTLRTCGTLCSEASHLPQTPDDFETTQSNHRP